MTSKNQLTGTNKLSRALLNATPLPMFVVDQDVKIIDFNAAAEKMLGNKRRFVLRKKGGIVLGCIHSGETPGGCGHSESCKRCALRGSVQCANRRKAIVRERADMELVSDDGVKQAHFLVSATPFNYLGERLVLLVLEDITELMNLRKMLPICGRCKKVRDSKDYWHRLDQFLAVTYQADVSQGLCPECISQARSLTPVLSGQRRARLVD